ncbi:MAG: TRAP transporter TatT component family protein [Thermodesulfobacteriota bacterium]|nr:TRAP transporter TatT component family protein [Thermodesulfobacteriota bacterium]
MGQRRNALIDPIHPFRRFLAAVAGLLLAAGNPGCASIIRKATQPTIQNILTATLKQQDLELVRDGAPGFLLFIDGLVEGAPEDTATLIAAARLYSAYGTAFVLDAEPDRAKIMLRKAREYAFRAAAIENPTFARLWDEPFDRFQPVARSFEKDDTELLFTVLSTWANDIRAHRDDWNAVAQLPKVQLLAERLLELDETYYFGSVHLLMGVLNSLLPPTAGGRPEVARRHFERAIEISEGRFLQVHVAYAEQYARLLYDRELHDRLLQHVMETPADIVPELTLANMLAKRRAAELLAEAEEYF